MILRPLSPPVLPFADVVVLVRADDVDDFGTLAPSVALSPEVVARTPVLHVMFYVKGKYLGKLGGSDEGGLCTTLPPGG